MDGFIIGTSDLVSMLVIKDFYYMSHNVKKLFYSWYFLVIIIQL